MDNVLWPALAEVGIISWRTVKKSQRPPLPSELLAVFLVFGAFGVVGRKEPRIGSALAWGLVIATFLNFAGTQDKLTGGLSNKVKAEAVQTRSTY